MSCYNYANYDSCAQRKLVAKEWYMSGERKMAMAFKLLCYDLQNSIENAIKILQQVRVLEKETYEDTHRGCLLAKPCRCDNGESCRVHYTEARKYYHSVVTDLNSLEKHLCSASSTNQNVIYNTQVIKKHMDDYKKCMEMWQ